MPERFNLEMPVVAVFALIVAFVLTMGLFVRPTYTDSFYHFNAAVSFANGDGLTDHVVWTYIGQPEPAVTPVFETPSHLYWMPLPALLSGVSMALFGVTYPAAQLPHLLLTAVTLMIAYWLGGYIGGGRRHAILTFVVVMFGGYFINFWGEIDTFAPYAVAGSLCLILLGRIPTGMRWWMVIVAGLLAGVGHLTRSDGLLLLMVGWLTFMYAWLIGFNGEKISAGQAWSRIGVFTLAYLIVMVPWFVRMMGIVGAPLPLGGLQAAWFTEYDDLFRYPAQMTATDFFSDGFAFFIDTRATGLLNNFQTFIAVEGFILFTPFMLLALWRRWRPFAFPMALFALGLHAAMTFAFPFPGFRGGLLHGAVALLPFWAAYGVAGIDEAVDLVAKRLEHWNPPVAKRNFSILLVALVGALTLALMRPERDTTPPELFAELDRLLAEDARVVSADPSEVYYWTGRGGVVMPNEAPETLLDLVERYGVTHLLIEFAPPDLALSDAEDDADEDEDVIIPLSEMTPILPSRLEPVLDASYQAVPDFLQPIPLETTGAQLYAILPINDSP